MLALGELQYSPDALGANPHRNRSPAFESTSSSLVAPLRKEDEILARMRISEVQGLLNELSLLLPEKGSGPVMLMLRKLLMRVGQRRYCATPR
jgi:hypothetical protein